MMRGSTLLAVGVAGVVAVAAVASSVRGGDDSPTATTAAATTAAVAETATAAAIPVGDLRRLPEPAAGAYTGRLLVFEAGTCRPQILHLDTLEMEDADGPPRNCTIWPSPAGSAVASIDLAERERVLIALSPEGPAVASGIIYPPGARGGALTVTDDGAVASCLASDVRVGRAGRAETVRSFTPVEGIFDERCVTGAVGERVVQLGDDRSSLVDVGTRQVVRRLAEPVREPLAGLTSSSDGLVIVVDTADGTPQGVVYAEDGSVVVPRLPVGTATRFRKLLLARGGGAVAILTGRGWQITSLRSGLTLAQPGGARVNDATFSPAGDAVAATTDVGILFAAIPGLAPVALLPGRFEGIAWLR